MASSPRMLYASVTFSKVALSPPCLSGWLFFDSCVAGRFMVSLARSTRPQRVARDPGLKRGEEKAMNEPRNICSLRPASSYALSVRAHGNGPVVELVAMSTHAENDYGATSRYGPLFEIAGFWNKLSWYRKTLLRRCCCDFVRARGCRRAMWWWWLSMCYHSDRPATSCTLRSGESRIDLAGTPNSGSSFMFQRLTS